MTGRLAAARDPWWVITGATVALHGGDTLLCDVDLLVSGRDARMLLGPDAPPGAPHPRHRSAVFGRIDNWPLTVEIMAGFDLYSHGIWQPVRFATREMVGVGEIELSVQTKHELAMLLGKLGRSKDHKRAAMLVS